MLIVAGITLLVVFAVVIAFMFHHFMNAHVTGATGHLSKLNSELLKQQSDLKLKISAAEKEYQKKMTNMRQEINDSKKQAQTEATKMLEEARSGAQQEKEKLVNEAVETRKKMRQEIYGEMEQKAIEYSKELFSYFFTGEIKKSGHEALIRQVITGLQEMDVAQFQIQTDTCQLETAIALDEKLAKEIKTVIKEKIKKDVKFEEKVNEVLVAGLVLKFGTFVIDGSLTNRLNEAAASISKETARRYQGAG